MVRLEGEIQVAQLSRMGGEPGFVDWKPEAPVTAPAPQMCLSFSVQPGAYQPRPVPALPEIPQDVKALAESLSNEELAYVCLGGFQDEGSKSVIGSAGMQVVGAAGETTNRYQDKGLPVLVMADGPAGLRLNKDYGKDGNGVYALEGSLPPGFAEFHGRGNRRGLGSMAKKEPERHGEILHQYCSALPIGTALAQSWNLELCRACAAT